MDENKKFSIEANVAPIEVLGFLEYAKAIIIRDAVPVNAAIDKQVTEETLPTVESNGSET